uniref:cytotoxic T-lymphocyte protein 4 n=1 Tax=Pristiophorus japonicus TaxID=55135 RepID=UPI00398F6DD3
MECLRNLLVIVLWAHTAGRLDAVLTVSQPLLLEVESTGEATLVCEHNCGDDAELKLTILKGWNKIVICNGTTKSSNSSVNSTRLLHCRIKRRPNKLSVTICGLNSSLIDSYFCKIQKMYPPPYEEKQGNGTTIYTRNEKNVKCSQFLLLLIVGILSILTLFSMIYSIVLTLVTHAAKKPRQKEEENAVYERMAPSTGREQSRRNTEPAATLAHKY